MENLMRLVCCVRLHGHFAVACPTFCCPATSPVSLPCASAEFITDHALVPRMRSLPNMLYNPQMATAAGFEAVKLYRDLFNFTLNYAYNPAETPAFVRSK